MYACAWVLLTWLAGARTVGHVLHASRRWTTTCAFTRVSGRTRVTRVANRTSIVPVCGSTWPRHTEVCRAAVDQPRLYQQHHVIIDNPPITRHHTRARSDDFRLSALGFSQIC